MSTTTFAATQPLRHDDSFRAALRLGLLFALLKFALHLATNLWQAHIGWGYFRDEFYYIACGHHLAWGYVDHGPVVALQARLAETLFGKSLAGLRALSAAAGAARVLLAGLLAWAMGGRRPAQGLAMICVLVAPIYLGLDSYLSMNSFESMFWMTCLLALVLLDQGRIRPVSAWILFGISAGVGLLNKPSMSFFLLALALAMLFSPQRRLLFTRYAALGIALLVAIALPNLLWQIHNHWPTLEFLHNGRVGNKNIVLGPAAFLLEQWRDLHPLSIFIWIPGLVWLLRRKPYRWLGIMWLLFFAAMLAMHAKDYYVAPVYPLLFAAGGVAWEGRFAKRRLVQRNLAFAFPIAELMLIATALVVLPLSLPVFTPQTWLRYTKATHLYAQNSNSENDPSGVLPQFFADRFGWQEEADKVSAIYHSLSPEDQRKAVVFTTNYGEAGSVLFLKGPADRPPVISRQNNFWLWGPQGATGEVVIAINGASLSDMLQSYHSCTIAARMDHPLSMPFERRNIYLCHGRVSSFATDWPELKVYF
jgi:hypothetical protein